MFSDDTNITGMNGEMSEGVRVVKSIMKKLERNHDAKEEELEFRTGWRGKTVL